MKSAIFFSTLAGIASALPTVSDFAVKDSFTVPRQWTRIGVPHPERPISIHIGLKQSRFDELERHLYEVSDPFHTRYGQHLTPAEVDELIKPTDDALESVHTWLESHGIGRDAVEHSSAKDFIMVTLPVSTIERMLNTEYSVYEHTDGSTTVRTPEWSLPEHLHEYIDSIQPTNSFLRANAQRRHIKPVSAQDIGETFPMTAGAMESSPPTVGQVCNVSAVTPTCLRVLYGTYSYKPQAVGKNSIGLTDYDMEANNRSDVKIFLQNYRPDATAYANQFTIDVIAGGNNQQTPDTPTQLAAGKDLEGNLDAETIIGITYPEKLTAYTTGGEPPFIPDKFTPTNTNEPYMTWINYVLGQSNVPQTISTSYGDDEQTVPPSYAAKVCQQFAQLGARGHTLVFSSGDSGVGKTGDCVSNTNGKRMFLPEFPGTCPYVTVVGALHQFNPQIVAYDPENGFVSGAGYSNYFARPSYQNSVVEAYIASLNGANSGLYNHTGRAYPDISAQGQHFITVWNGTGVLLDGTSCSSPTAASVISLVNDALIAAGKSPLGFMNPWLYSVGHQGFTDITGGNTMGCDTQGFPAKAGWDSASGWGSPNFPKLKELALQKYGN